MKQEEIFMSEQADNALKAKEEPLPEIDVAASAGVVEVNRPIESAIDTIREIFISLL